MLQTDPKALLKGAASAFRLVTASLSKGLTVLFMKLRKLLHARRKKNELYDFLLGQETLVFNAEDKPLVAIILILFNRAELTLACLKSLQANMDRPFDLVIVDNNSSDETRLLLKKIENAKLILNDDNVGFLRACNQAAHDIRAPNILFLNNDAVLEDSGISDAMDLLDSDNTIGAVGARIALLDDSLQEAGSIIWSDGSCLGYGRGWSLDDPRANFQRDVDYCSGAFLLTPTALFRKLDGFDATFEPAYYEETDYCVRLHRAGYRVVYQPKTLITHFEFASSSSNDSAVDLMRKNAETFRKKHQHFLETRLQPDPSSVARAKHYDHSRVRVLYIDDRVPHRYHGAGFPRSNSVVRALVDHGAHVTVMPYNFPFEDTIRSQHKDLPDVVEVLIGYGRHNVSAILSPDENAYDVVWVSRPHNMVHFRAVMEAGIKGNPKIVYDAEALFSTREIMRSEVLGSPLSTKKQRQLVDDELALMSDVDHIITVNEAEKSRVQKGIGPATSAIHIIGHSMDVALTHSGFDERTTILFVGNMDFCQAPNADSVLWFIENVWDLIQQKVPEAQLELVGSCECDSIKNINATGVEVVGRVEDLRPYYEKAKVLIAPTRFAAGIPCKVHEAAAVGVPVVTSDVIDQQLGWTALSATLSAKAPEEFAAQCVALYTDRVLWEKTRGAALEQVVAECNPETFSDRVKHVLRQLSGKEPWGSSA